MRRADNHNRTDNTSNHRQSVEPAPKVLTFEMAPIQFGILMFDWQLSDVTGPVDVLSSSSARYLRSFSEVAGYSEDLISRGLDVEFHYVGPSVDTPITATGNCKILCSTDFDSCPKLDYLLVGGPDPGFFLNVPASYVKFLHDRVQEVKTIFTTCTGAGILGSAGLLDGLDATINHQCVPLVRKVLPKVKWTDKSQWVVSGQVDEQGEAKFWTAGGACAGMDMLAHWVSERCGRDVAEAGFAALDYEPRDVQGNLVPLKNGLRKR